MRTLPLCLILISAWTTSNAGDVVAVHDAGKSVQYRKEDGLGNYEFGYDEKHPTGGTFRKERGDSYGNKEGSYGLHDIDGRVRIVNYVADDHGFRAAISTNEPGVSGESPAAVSITKYNPPMHFSTLLGHAALGVPLDVISPKPAAIYAGPDGVVGHTSVLGQGPIIGHGGPVVAHAAPLAHSASIVAPAPVIQAAPFAHAAPIAHAGPIVATGAAYHGGYAAAAPIYKPPMHFSTLLGAGAFHRPVPYDVLAAKPYGYGAGINYGAAAPISYAAAPAVIKTPIAYAAPAPVAYAAPAPVAYAAPAPVAYAGPSPAVYAAPAVVKAPVYSAPLAQAYSAPIAATYAAPAGIVKAPIGPGVSYAAPIAAAYAAPAIAYKPPMHFSSVLGASAFNHPIPYDIIDAKPALSYSAPIPAYAAPGTAIAKVAAPAVYAGPAYGHGGIVAAAAPAVYGGGPIGGAYYGEGPALAVQAAAPAIYAAKTLNAAVAPIGAVTDGVSYLTRGAYGYDHTLVKPHAYHNQYFWSSPTFYGFSYGGVPFAPEWRKRR